jgi:amidophosphoribosyltransferase
MAAGVTLYRYPGYNIKVKEKCGLFGIFGSPEAANLTLLGLYALQHRGQESAGMVVSDGCRVRHHVGMGEAAQVFTPPVLQELTGHLAVGHVRYSTTGTTSLRNAQPFLADYYGGVIAVAHNGNLTNTRKLRRMLEGQGGLFHTTSDSELVLHLLSHSGPKSFPENLVQALSKVEGAYSLLFMTRDRLIAARDPCGFRPLCIGRINGGFVIASETAALDMVEAEYLREVEPGEIVIVSKDGLESVRLPVKPRPAFCIFEHIYFARPDSLVFGHSVYQTRKELGRALARAAPVKGDLVMPVPDSGVYAALSYAQETGLPLEMGFIRNHYVGRTFIQPVQRIRDLEVKIKLNPVREVVAGKKVVLIDDSLVRGTTSRNRVILLRKCGAREIHLRIACPPHRFSCYFGIDFPDPAQLLANRYEPKEMADYLQLDSLEYLDCAGMLDAMPLPGDQFCAACFNGDYPVVPDEGFQKDLLEEKGRGQEHG